MITGSRSPCSVERRGPSHYKSPTSPQSRGDTSYMHIKVRGSHVRGSPLSVAVKAPFQPNLSTPILTIGGMEKPWGIAINQRGEMVVTETRGHCISVFSPGGRKLQCIDARDSEHSHWQVCGVAVDMVRGVF